MKPPNKKSERIAGIILSVLLFGGLVIGAIWFYQYKAREARLMSIEEAMYVTDWDITTIYGPRTPQQARIVKQFRSYGGDKLEFDAPVLYRMHASASGNTGEGILLMGFDPKNPETAFHLKAAQQK